MPILITKEITRTDWELVGPKVVAAYDPPPEGFVAHFATESGSGANAMDIWESREHYDVFAAEVLGPCIRKAEAELGITVDGPSSVVFVEAFDLVCRR